MTMALSLKAAVSPALLKSGGVNVIGLEKIRAHAGARWDRMRDSIHARVETVLQALLGPADFFMRLNDTAYLVIMTSFDADSARISCLKASYELHASLLGRYDFSDLSLSRATGWTDDLLALEPFAAGELRDLASRAGIKDLGAEESPPAPVNSATAAKAEAPAKPRAADRYRFAPVWNMDREVISSFRLESCGPMASKPINSLANGATFREQLRLFLEGFDHATNVMAKRIDDGGRFLMVIPIAYEILSSPLGRMAFSTACRDLPGTFRPLLVFEIADVPLGVPQSRMGELVCGIRPFCKAVMMQLPIGAHDHMVYGNVGLQGLGFALPAAPECERTRVEIAKLATVTKRLGVASFLIGVSTFEMANFAHAAGLNMICGPVLGPAVEVPDQMRRLLWSDFRHYRESDPRNMQREAAGS